MLKVVLSLKKITDGKGCETVFDNRYLIGEFAHINKAMCVGQIGRKPKRCLKTQKNMGTGIQRLYRPVLIITVRRKTDSRAASQEESVSAWQCGVYKAEGHFEIAQRHWCTICIGLAGVPLFVSFIHKLQHGPEDPVLFQGNLAENTTHKSSFACC